MITYKFCTKVQKPLNLLKIKRSESIVAKHKFDDPLILKVMRQKLGLLSFLFTDELLQQFSKSNYMQLYKQHQLTMPNKKSQVSCLDFMKNNKLKQKLGAYINFLYNQHQWKVVISKQLSRLTDLSTPHKWYPEARKIKRKFIIHHGPTNSGKTRSAVTALQLQKQNNDTMKSIYMAPLRLLAWQIQQRLNPCNLITGQQKIVVESKLTSCTIETANFLREYKIAVIDEIQMIGDKQRGWGWTKAILNTKSEQIHLCGQSRPLHLISKLISLTGDTLQQRRYPRLSKLILQKKIFRFKDLLPGDCIIAFGTKTLHKIRVQIFKQFGIKSALIYGKLPPQVRKKQAQQFNNGNLPILISTNAIGMGLNLQIKRIIFYETQKVEYAGGQKQPLDDYMIQQIAGRAGRGLTNGQVLCMNRVCLQRVKTALKNVNVPMVIQTQQNTLEQISDEQIQNKQTKKNQEQDHFLKRSLSEYQKSITQGMLFIEEDHLFLDEQNPKRIKLSQSIQQFFKDAKTADYYSLIEAPKFSNLVQKFQNIGMNSSQSFNFFNIPQSKNKREFHLIVTQLAKQFLTRNPVKIPNYILDKLKQNLDLKQLQNIYSLLQVYIWLSNKYELAFIYADEVAAIKQNICTRINEKLKGFRVKEKY